MEKKIENDKKDKFDSVLRVLFTALLLMTVAAEAAAVIILSGWLKAPRQDDESFDLTALDNMALTGNQACIIAEAILEDYKIKGSDGSEYFVEIDNGNKVTRYLSILSKADKKAMRDKDSNSSYVGASDTYISELIKNEENEIVGVRLRKYSN